MNTRRRLILNRQILATMAMLLAACSPDSGQEAGSPAEMTSMPLPPGAEAVSFLGDTLMPPEQSEEVRAVYMARYEEAEEALAAAPEDVEALIWMGRRIAYLGRYREAIEIYSDAIDLHPEDARL